MNIQIDRPHASRRHVYQILGAEGTGKTDFMETIASISEGGEVIRMTGAELSSPFAYQRLEGKEVLLIEDLMPDQCDELKALVSQESMLVQRKGRPSYHTPCTIKCVFYVMSTRIPKDRQGMGIK